MNKLAYLFAGMVAGAVGMAVAKDLKNGKGTCSLKGVVQGGHNVVEKVLGAAETLKEDVEDYLAESKYLHEEKVKAEATTAADVPEDQAPEEENTPTEEVVVEKPAPKKAAPKAPAKPRAKAKEKPKSTE